MKESQTAKGKGSKGAKTGGTGAFMKAPINWITDSVTGDSRHPNAQSNESAGNSTNDEKAHVSRLVALIVNCFTCTTHAGHCCYISQLLDLYPGLHLRMDSPFMNTLAKYTVSDIVLYRSQHLT